MRISVSMRLAFVLLLAACGASPAERPDDLSLASDLDLPPVDLAHPRVDAGTGDLAGPADLQIADMPLGADFAALPDLTPVVDMTSVDMTPPPCGKAGQACCYNGGGGNPNYCTAGPGVACRSTDNICAYCGSGGQICCPGDSCTPLPGQTLTCTLRPGDTQKTCN